MAPAAGEEIFGRLLLAGSVKDGGAVARLELSLDGRDFTPLEGTGSFWADLDPAVLPATLQRLAVRATDRAGNSATAEVGLRLASTPPAAAPPTAAAAGAAKDTVKPVVELLWPPKEARLHGRVAFIGRASDDRGLKRLAFDAGGGRKGEVELTAGSPYWAKELDFGDLKGAKPAVSFTAEDLSGNRAELRLAAPVDPASDLPVVEIAQPADKGQVEGARAWPCAGRSATTRGCPASSGPWTGGRSRSWPAPRPSPSCSPTCRPARTGWPSGRWTAAGRPA